MCNEGCVTSQLVLLQRSVTRSVTNVRRGSVTDPSKKITAIYIYIYIHPCGEDVLALLLKSGSFVFPERANCPSHWAIWELQWTESVREIRFDTVVETICRYRRIDSFQRFLGGGFRNHVGHGKLQAQPWKECWGFTKRSGSTPKLGNRLEW